MSFSRLLLASLIAFGLATYALGAAVLPDDEVKALRDIAKTLGKTDWNFSADPCGGQWGWANPKAEDGSENAVSCNCIFSNGTICHVTSIVLKNQNLQGSLPPDLSRFPYLQEIDLSRNYLDGTIPREWGATQMVNISIIGNRFTGPIPREIGNIRTLVNFTVEFNQFSGVLPPELGNLSRLEKLHLTSNKFTGPLPAAFEKLTALKDFRIGDNQFTGEIPNLIQNWTNLQKLVIQGSGLSGPIPLGIAVLEKMTDLRISDLQGNGTGAPFPPLANMTKLKTLILRSCNIIGRIPDFVGEFSSLKTLDLSFNKLDGEIPDSFLGVKKANYIYLTGNQLNGTVPDWIIKDGKSVDLSYNNFRNESSCQQGNINLFGSASMGNVSGSTVPCLRSQPCQKKFYSFHINCGGNAATIEGISYEDDTDPAGPSRLYHRSNWAVSTTGHFMDNNYDRDSYTCPNSTKLSANTSSLYMDARLSPLSLTYYGFCMESGNYTVSLHFAEIMFTNDNTSSSLGRRFFDIYIQGKLVQKNFSIQNEAGGVGKAIIKNFTAIVTGGALEIRFYWAGKGTTGLPVRGVYGPLISAISVTPDFKPPSENSRSIAAGTVVGIVAAAVVFVFLILGILCDLSYNNFRNESSCQQRNINLFGSASMGNVSGRTVPCLRSLPCQKKFYSFHINCGGKEATIEGNLYEDDTDPAGPSRLYQRSNWAVSTTGHFMDDDRNPDSYIWTNSTKLSANTSSLYMDARLSPLSLTYYGLCMESGNYTVSLHFAEIMFTNDNTSSSLGRRFFDIYIQGKLVQKNFSIQNEAGGVGKAIIKNFTAIVTGNALEIRFYWAGKGTTGLPVRGVYGPLISAISVTSDFKPPSENSSSTGISAGTVVGIVAAAVVFVFLILGILWWKGCFGQKISMRHDLKGLDLNTGKFTLKQIKAATNNFDPANKIGEGGFGPVYKGLLLDGTIIAVKQLSSKSKQGNREFVNEIGMISALQHPHLVKLHGCCIEGDQLLLVYEYMENNSLARALFGPEEYRLNLDWATRQKICVGIARGLAYLHEESRLKIVHRDIKATNVLLDENLDPKISDFGLARLDEEDNTHISTRVAGTYGYMAPEYAMRGYLTDKADVYSFGIVALEIVSGKSNTSHRGKEDTIYLLDWALFLKEGGTLLELVDPSLGQDYNKEEVITMINVALLCSNVSAAVRPAMSAVVSMLEGKAAVQDFDIADKSKSMDEHKIEEMRKHFQVINRQEISETQTQSMSMDGPWTAASTSDGDLYPISLNSDYLKGRD